MPNCQAHDDCDLVCTCPRGYYCQEEHAGQWRHERRPDMPDDLDEFYNERAERMP